jgi:hypothetical protein
MHFLLFSYSWSTFLSYEGIKIVLRQLLSPLGCNEPAYACGGAGVVEDASAAQNVGAGCCPGAEMVLASCVLNIQGQLAGGKGSRAENSGGHCCKNDVLDCPTHGSSSLFQQSFLTEMESPSYLAGAWTPVGCVEQKPVVDSSGKAQMQPVLHGGWPTPQLPPQVKPLDSLRNCRAESVPTPRTAVIIAASKKFLIVCLLMNHSPVWRWVSSSSMDVNKKCSTGTGQRRNFESSSSTSGQRSSAQQSAEDEYSQGRERQREEFGDRDRFPSDLKG